MQKIEMLGNAGNNLKKKAEEDSRKKMCVCVRVCVQGVGHPVVMSDWHRQ